MLKYIFALLVLVHGLIHLMGFAKAFAWGNVSQITRTISKPIGILWLAVALLFLLCLYLFFVRSTQWPVFAVAAAVLSQVLIFTVWKDAKFGTIANMVILLLALAAWATNRFERRFKNDVTKQLASIKMANNDLLTEVDIAHLPLPVQRYIRYTGAIGKPKVQNVRIVLEGEMRSKKRDWFPFKVVQYNFFEEPTRLFFMNAKMFALDVPGYHAYQNGHASMQVKLFGIFSVMQASGDVMDKAETVTVFNDMCMMVPATLIDKRIAWKLIDSLTAEASFTNGKNKITATLFFNEHGELVNFISDDRTDINDMKQYRFATPLKHYLLLNGRNTMKYGEAVWHYPEGEFVYGKFNLKSIEYNVSDFNP